jgi:hypothetical protein
MIAGLVTGNKMEIQNKIPNKKNIERKKFFAGFGKGLLAVTFFSLVPFKLFSKNSRHVKVEINPLAVSRKKDRVHG